MPKEVEKLFPKYMDHDPDFHQPMDTNVVK
jgi:hypothetical protein